MSIILEGCDCSGKTTLAKSLKWPELVGNRFARGRATLDDCWKRFKPGYNIISRWWMTEYIYDKVLRGQNVCTTLDMWKFKMYGDKTGTVMLWMDPGLQTILERYLQRNDTQSIEYIKLIYLAYSGFRHTHAKFLPMSFGIEELGLALYRHDLLQKRAEKLMSFDVCSTGTLNNNCKLICGPEVLGDNFIKCLAELGLNPNNLHLLKLWNGKGLTGNYKAAIALLSPCKIIALDEKTNSFLRKGGFNTTRLDYTGQNFNEKSVEAIQ